MDHSEIVSRSIMSIPEAMLGALRHYPSHDYPLFAGGYTRLIGDGLAGKCIIEVCCGKGDLAAGLAKTFPDATIRGIDYWEVHIEAAKRAHGEYGNLTFRVGDALRLDDFPDASVDVVVGQATLHHLSNNLPGASREFSRVLKPGGTCAFIFEPLGHNPMISAIRGALNARRQWIDESNLFLGAIEDFARNFARFEMDFYNLLGYAFKPLPDWRWLRPFARGTFHLDQFLFRTFAGLRRQAANFNVFFYK